MTRLSTDQLVAASERLARAARIVHDERIARKAREIRRELDRRHDAFLKAVAGWSKA